MNFSQFHEIVLHQGYCHFERRNASTEHTRLARVFLANNVYNAKFSLKARLEHGFAIEYTYLQ